MFPSGDGQTVGGSEYGFVVRADQSTTEVWYKIDDSDASNDDGVTLANNGNGVWVRASEVSPNASVVPSDPSYTREFRFNYVNIPSSGGGTVLVRLKELSSSEDNGLTDVAAEFHHPHPHGRHGGSGLPHVYRLASGRRNRDQR